MTNVPKPDSCMYVATQTVYESCSASVPFFTWFLENTAAVRRIATQYSINSSSVGSDRTRSAGVVPGRTTGKDSSVSDPEGSSGSIAAVGRYLTFSVSLPRSVAVGPASSMVPHGRAASDDLLSHALRSRDRATRRRLTAA